MNSHTETIKCPECSKVQDAEVEHTNLWNIYVHVCCSCAYIIMETDWVRITTKSEQNEKATL